MIGRSRPVEQDAARVLTVVHQLGEQHDGSTPAGEWFIDTESQLQHLDHLVRHPIDLAYVLMDQVRSGLDDPRATAAEIGTRLGELAGRVRRLLGAASGKTADGKRRKRHRPSLLRPFETGSWQRWDDVLAVLGCRGLLRVEPAPGDGGGGELRYRLTTGGARWLRESVYPRQNEVNSTSTTRERCELLRDVLPARLLSPRPDDLLGPYLHDIAERLDTYRGDEQIRPEDDLLGRLFQSTFAEQL